MLLAKPNVGVLLPPPTTAEPSMDTLQVVCTVARGLQRGGEARGLSLAEQPWPSSKACALYLHSQTCEEQTPAAQEEPFALLQTAATQHAAKKESQGVKRLEMEPEPIAIGSEFVAVLAGPRPATTAALQAERPSVPLPSSAAAALETAGVISVPISAPASGDVPMHPVVCAPVPGDTSIHLPSLSTAAAGAMAVATPDLESEAIKRVTHQAKALRTEQSQTQGELDALTHVIRGIEVNHAACHTSPCPSCMQLARCVGHSLLHSAASFTAPTSVPTSVPTSPLAAPSLPTLSFATPSVPSSPFASASMPNTPFANAVPVHGGTGSSSGSVPGSEPSGQQGGPPVVRIPHDTAPTPDSMLAPPAPPPLAAPVVVCAEPPLANAAPVPAAIVTAAPVIDASPLPEPHPPTPTLPPVQLLAPLMPKPPDSPADLPSEVLPPDVLPPGTVVKIVNVNKVLTNVGSILTINQDVGKVCAQLAQHARAESCAMQMPARRPCPWHVHARH